MASKGKVLVTGGAGFIGSHTVVQLHEAGYSPVIVDNFCNSRRGIIGRLERITGVRFPVHEVDCSDAQAMDRVANTEGRCVGVIHFAAHKAVGASVGAPLAYYENNLGSLVCILGLVEKHQIPALVFSSSCTVYGQPDTLPVTEESPIKPAESPYGRTKQFCESIIEDQVASGAQLKAVRLRYFNPIGAHASGLIGELPLGPPENLVPYITQTAAGLREELTVFGKDYQTSDGTCVRDYIHVVDLADAHVRALDWIALQPGPALSSVFNVGTGRGSTVLQAIEAFETASGQKLKYRIGARRPGDVVETYASVDRVQTELGWTARLSLVEAMRDAYRWQMKLKEEPLSDD